VAKAILAACTGIVTSCASIASGAVYARYGEGVYYMMAAMAAAGAPDDVAFRGIGLASSP